MHTFLEIAGPELAMVLVLLTLKLTGHGWVVERLVSTCRLARQDRRIPAVGRWLLALAIIPIPGPFDEICASLAAAVLMVRPSSRVAIAEAWRASL